MTVSTTQSRNSAAGNGVTTAFAFPYYFLSDGDLVVISKDDTTKVETPQILNTDYTVSGAGSQAGGTITFLSAPASGKTITIYRDPATTQSFDLVENDNLPAESAEQAYDRLAMISQRLKDRVDRSIRLTDGYADSFDTTLPEDLADSGDRVVTVNATADAFADAADWPTVDNINNAQTYANNAAASAAAASASASAASTSASNAATSASAAATSASAAATSASNAATSEANAAAAATTVLNTHLTDTTDAHDASAISSVPSGNLAASDVQSALDELQSDIDSKFDTTTGHDHDGTDSKKVLGTNIDSAATTNGFVLTANGSGGSAWTSPSGVLADSVKTTNYTLTDSDDIIFVDDSGGAVVITLHDAASAQQKIYRIKKTSNTTTASSLSSGQLIDGSATRGLNTYNEEYEIFPDGTNWQILNHKTMTPWTSFSMTIGGSTSAPTKATTTIRDSAKWRRVGKDMQIRYEYKHTDATGSASGTGDYLFPIPNSLSADTTDLSVATDGGSIVGPAALGSSGATDGVKYHCYVALYNSTNLALRHDQLAATSEWVSSALENITATYTIYSFIASVPISGWDE